MELDRENALRAALENLVAQTCPDAELTPKYGGHMVQPDATDTKRFIGGFFFYAQHASFEFTNGATLDDPNGHLEGTGKFRRHIKLETLQDIETKDVSKFLTQALAQHS